MLDYCVTRLILLIPSIIRENLMAPKIPRQPHIRQLTPFPRRLHRKLTQRLLLPVNFVIVLLQRCEIIPALFSKRYAKPILLTSHVLSFKHCIIARQ